MLSNWFSNANVKRVSEDDQTCGVDCIRWTGVFALDYTAIRYSTSQSNLQGKGGDMAGKITRMSAHSEAVVMKN